MTNFQYGVLTRDENDGQICSGGDFHLTPALAIDDAFESYRSPVATHLRIFAIIRVDVDTGEANTLLTKRQLTEIFDTKEEQAMTDEERHDQGIIDRYNFTHDASL